MEPDVLGFRPLVASWLKGLPPTFKDTHKTLIEELCDNIIAGATVFIRKQCKEVIRTVNSSLCASCLRMLGSICSRYRPVDKPADGEQGDVLLSRLPAAFIFSFVWSFGVAVDGKLNARLSESPLARRHS